MTRRSQTGDPLDDTGRMVSAAFPAEHADLGNAEKSIQPAVEQLAGHFMRKARKGNAVIVVALTALFGTGGYFAQQAAVDRHTDELEQLGDDVEAHEDRPAHDGAVSQEQLGEVERRVIAIDRDVAKIGQQLDSEAVRQKERHDDLKEELRYLRRRRRDR